MSPLVDKIEAEIKQLSPPDQLDLFARLETMMYGDDDDIEESPALIETIRRRVEEIESGKVQGIPVEETFERINREIKAKYS